MLGGLCSEQKENHQSWEQVTISLASGHLLEDSQVGPKEVRAHCRGDEAPALHTPRSPGPHASCLCQGPADHSISFI